MSYTDAKRMARAGLAAGGLAALTLLAACTSGPAYAPQTSAPQTPDVSGPPLLSELRGRVAVREANSRTEQIFRNALLFRLNGSEPVRDARYQVNYSITALDSVTSVESGSGIPSAASYRMQADYTIVRLSDNETIGAGSRFSTVPYDRNSQLYASQSAVEDARARAGKELAERVGMALLPVLKREPGAGIN